MTDESLSVLAELVKFKTTTGNTHDVLACFDFVAKQLSTLPFKIHKYASNGVESWLWESSPKKGILLNAHIDVVPASDTLFTMSQKGDRIVGRGVSDMKFAVATFIAVLQKIYAEKKELPLVDILLTSDEEVGGANGVGHFVKSHRLGYKVVIIPDGGDDWHIVEEAKGVLHLKLTAHGKSAHASRPWEGQNAADRLFADLLRLRTVYPELTTEDWKTTLNIGQIHAGTQTNQVPDSAVAMLDIRFIARENKEAIKNKVKEMCSQSKVEVVLDADPFFIQKDNSIVQEWAKLLPENSHNPFVRETGASDGRYFSKFKIPVLLSKPIGGAIHTEHEWLSLTSFSEYQRVLYQFLMLQFSDDHTFLPSV